MQLLLVLLPCGAASAAAVAVVQRMSTAHMQLLLHRGGDAALTTPAPAAERSKCMCVCVHMHAPTTSVGFVLTWAGLGHRHCMVCFSVCVNASARESERHREACERCERCPQVVCACVLLCIGVYHILHAGVTGWAAAGCCV